MSESKHPTPRQRPEAPLDGNGLSSGLAAPVRSSLRSLRDLLPQPPSLALHRLLVQLASSGEDSGGILVEAWCDLFVRTACAWLLADYLGGPPDERVESALKSLGRPCFGHWVQLHRVLVECLARRKSPAPFFPGVPLWYRSRLDCGATPAELLDSLPQRRNGIRHPLSSSNPEAIAACVLDLLQSMAHLALSATWMSENLLLRVRSVDAVPGGTFSGKVEVYRGHELQPLPRSAVWRGHLTRGPLYLVSPDGSSALPVSPLLEARMGPSGATDLYLLKDLPECTQLRLVHDVTGQQVALPLQRTGQDWLSSIRYSLNVVSDLGMELAPGEGASQTTPSQMEPDAPCAPVPHIGRAPRLAPNPPKGLVGLESEVSFDKKGDQTLRKSLFRLRLWKFTLVELVTTVALGMALAVLGIQYVVPPLTGRGTTEWGYRVAPLANSIPPESRAARQDPPSNTDAGIEVRPPELRSRFAWLKPGDTVMRGDVVLGTEPDLMAQFPFYRRECSGEQLSVLAVFVLGESAGMLECNRKVGSPSIRCPHDAEAASLQAALLGKSLTAGQVAAGELLSLVTRYWGRNAEPWYELGRAAWLVSESGAQAATGWTSLQENRTLLLRSAPECASHQLAAFLAAPSRETGERTLASVDACLARMRFGSEHQDAADSPVGGTIQP